MDAVCPKCGQRTLVRHGVRLPPKLSDLLDAIEEGGAAGVHVDVLVRTLYSGKEPARARLAIKTNIYHLNDRLETTGKRVRNMPPRSRCYRLVTEAKP